MISERKRKEKKKRKIEKGKEKEKKRREDEDKAIIRSLLSAPIFNIHVIVSSHKSTKGRLSFHFGILFLSVSSFSFCLALSSSSQYLLSSRSHYHARKRSSPISTSAVCLTVLCGWICVQVCSFYHILLLYRLMSFNSSLYSSLYTLRYLYLSLPYLLTPSPDPSSTCTNATRRAGR